MMVVYAASRNGAITSQDLRLKADAPLVRGDGFGLRLLLGYGMTHLDLGAGDQRDSFDLHRFEATLGGAKALGPGKTLRVALGTAYASDLQASTWRAFQLTSLAVVHWVLGPDDAILLGAVYTSTAEFAPVVPILGYVHQRDGSRFRFDMFLPRHIRAEYELHPRVRGALGLEIAGYTWAVQGTQSHPLIRRAGGDVFGELGFRLTRLVRLEARVGVSTTRSTLPAEATDVMISSSPRPAGFAQLALLLDR
jgi:hypothetical protein